MRPQTVRSLAIVAALGSLLPVSLARASERPAGSPIVARDAEAVVLTGAQLPSWSRLAADGTPAPYPSGSAAGQRDAHNGTVVVPPDLREGVSVDQVVAYRWSGSGFVEVPVQVDERMP